MPKAYFIYSDQYLRYDVEADSADPDYPKPLTAGYLNLEGTGFEYGCDCVVDLGAGYIYLFSGPNYLRINQTTNAVDGVVSSIADNWPGFTEAGFADGVDAAVNWGDGTIYFMRGDSYVSYDIESDTVTGGPALIADDWHGLADIGFGSDIDAMVNLGTGAVHIFKGDQYVRYDMAADAADAGYPLPIAGNWPGLEEAGFALGLSAAWLKLEPEGQAENPQPVGAVEPGTQLWYWNGLISYDKKVPRSQWFPGSNPHDENDYGGNGGDIFNFVVHSDGTIDKGQPHMRNRPGSFAWLARNPGNLTGLPGGPNFGQYPGKFHWHNFLIFPTRDAGFAAIAPFLRGANFRDLTILKAFEKYAPAGDGGNDPVRYANEAAAAAGLPTSFIIRDLDDQQMFQVQTRIAAMEGAIPGTTLPWGSPDLPAAVLALFG